jgi:hypothetical protein
MSVSIRQALQNVANYPEPLTDDVVNMPVHELVARSLFDIANRPDQRVRGSMSRANKARKMILERLDGKRRTGTKPAVKQGHEVEFIDLTGKEISEPGEGVQPTD